MENSKLDSQTLTKNIRALERVLALKAKTYGVDLTVSQERSFDHLSRLEPSVLVKIVENLQQQSHVFDLCMQEDVDPWCDKEFLELSMRASRLSFSREVYARLESDDIVEAYDFDRRQIFRNMRFMQSSSYSLAEIMAYDWTVLFERSSAITAQIKEFGENIVWSENKITESPTPKHLIRETYSAEPQVCEVQHRFFAPLFAGPNQPAGVISVCKGRVLGAELERIEDNLSFI